MMTGGRRFFSLVVLCCLVFALVVAFQRFVLLWPKVKLVLPTATAKQIAVAASITYSDSHLLRGLTQGQLMDNSVTNPVQGKSSTCKSTPFVVIVISSAPGNYRQRNAIRTSWGAISSAKGLNLESTNSLHKFTTVIKTAFLLGRARDTRVQDEVESEGEKYGDIVFGDFIEDYRNLTLKTRLGMKWAHFHCNAPFFLKTDDDVFINPQHLVEWLTTQPSDKFYTGWCNFGSKPVRQKGHKWYVSEEDFPGHTYPGYCLGGGYLMSTDVLAGVVKMTYGRKLFPMEDLYVGLMVKDLEDVPPTDNKAKFNLVFSGIRATCDFNNLILAHPVQSSMLADMTYKAQVAQRSCS